MTRSLDEVAAALGAARLRTAAYRERIDELLGDLDRNRPADPWNVGEPLRSLLLDAAERLDHAEREEGSLLVELDHVARHSVAPA